MEPSQLAQWAQLFALAGGGIWAIWIYRKDVKLKQTDWLYQLFEKFYESTQFKAIRRILDNEESAEYARLAQAASNLEDSQLQEDLIDFLNFFEFICSLVETKRMSRDDVNRLFGYYLTMLSQRDFVIAYASAQGFEALAKELKRRSDVHAK